MIVELLNLSLSDKDKALWSTLVEQVLVIWYRIPLLIDVIVVYRSKMSSFSLTLPSNSSMNYHPNNAVSDADTLHTYCLRHVIGGHK